MSNVVSLVGLKLGKLTVIGQSLTGRGSNGCLVWRCRCSECGSERTVTGTYISNVRRRSGVLACPTCSNRTRRCGLCGRQGHASAACEKRRPKTICELCGSLPHRVTGPRCRRCRLRYEAEPCEGIDYGARNPSALARLMGGGA